MKLGQVHEKQNRGRNTGIVLMTAWTLSTALAFAGGCAVDVAESEQEAVAVIEQPLYADKFTYWPSAGTSRIDINVCWENPSATTSAWKVERRGIVDRNWARYSRINYYQWDTCTSGEPGIHIRACSAYDPFFCGSFPRSSARIGKTIDGFNNGMQLNLFDNVFVTMHEFGHSLGFYHEQDRPDYVGTPACPATPGAGLIPQRYGGLDPLSVMSTGACPGGLGLSPNDMAGLQRAYGRRIPGTLISTQAKCASTSTAGTAGSSMFLFDCHESIDQRWRFVTSTGNRRFLQMNGTFFTSCLASNSVNVGSPLVLTQCTSGKDWVFDQMALRGAGGMCLDLPNSNTTNGTQLQMWTCAPGAPSQQFAIAGSAIKFGGQFSNKCLRKLNNQLVIWDCGASGETFSFNNTGNLINGGTCMDVSNVSDEQFLAGQGVFKNGDRVGFFTCTANTLNQMWNLSGAIRLGSNTSICMARDGVDAPGTGLKLAACNGGIEQEWDYYFKQ